MRPCIASTSRVSHACRLSRAFPSLTPHPIGELSNHDSTWCSSQFFSASSHAMTCGFPLLFAGWLSTSASNSQLIASVVGATHVDEAADRPSAQDIPSGQPTSRPWARAFGISTCHPRDEILPRNDPRGAPAQAKLAPSGDVWRRELAEHGGTIPPVPPLVKSRLKPLTLTKFGPKKEPPKSHQTGALANLTREEFLNRAGSSPVHPAIFEVKFPAPDPLQRESDLVRSFRGTNQGFASPFSGSSQTGPPSTRNLAYPQNRGLGPSREPDHFLGPDFPFGFMFRVIVEPAG